MKSIAKFITLCLLAGSLTSCGGGSGSSSGCFGSIPSEINKLDGNDNSDSKINKAAQSIEKMAKELDGKTLNVEIGTGLKMDQPLSLKFESMNVFRPVFGFAGSLVADKDLTLNIDPSELKSSSILNNIVIGVKMPVSMDCLSKDGTVIYSFEDIGTLTAENLETSAVVKAGTPVDFRTICILGSLAGTEQLRFYVDLDKQPYTQRHLVN